jgi:hypothetical protein
MWFRYAFNLCTAKVGANLRKHRIKYVLRNIFINLLVRTRLIKTLYIQKWYGRAGNNVIQLINAGIFSERHGVNILIPNNKDFSGTESLNGKIQTTDRSSKILCDTFFYDTCLFPLARSNEYPKTIENIQTIVAGNKVLKPLSSMVIHVRSGDIFKNPHPLYWQPPLDFYRKVIVMADDRPIFLVYDGDKGNPVIDILNNEYGDRIQLISKSVMEDYQMLMSATHLVLSRSSFANTAALLSKNLEHLFDFSGCFSLHNFPIDQISKKAKVHTFQSKIYSEYYAKNPWQASPFQMELMLNCNDIVLEDLSHLPSPQ